MFISMLKINLLLKKLKSISKTFIGLFFKYWYYLVIAILICLSLFLYIHRDKTEPQIVQSPVIENPNELSKKIDVPISTSKEIQKEIHYVTTKPPSYSYSVPSSNTQEAAETVKKSIDKGTAPKEVLEKSDRTIITTKETKVDVYKVNLEKKTKLKAGVSIIDDKTYPTIAVEHKDLEVAYNKKSLTVMYTVKKWYRDWETDRKSTRLNSSHSAKSRMPSSA